MKKVLLVFSLALCTNLLGCTVQSNNQNNENNQAQNEEPPKQITINGGADVGGIPNSNLDKEAFRKVYNPFELKDSAVYTSLFQTNEEMLVFPNWDDNNNLSVVKEPYPQNVINTSNVNDFYNYPINSLVVMDNIAYFSDADNNSKLSRIDLENREYTPNILTEKVSNMIGVNDVIYFIDPDNENRLHAFNTADNTNAIISQDNVGNYLVDDDTILYENKSDKSTLYSIKVDGTEKQKLSNFSVNSFGHYKGQVLAFNSSDNNNLYSIDLADLSTKRLAVMDGEDMKIFNGKIYFINLSNNRHLSEMTVDLAAPTVNFTDISDYAVNEYYPTDKGIFARKGVNVNNGYIYLPI